MLIVREGSLLLGRRNWEPRAWLLLALPLALITLASLLAPWHALSSRVLGSSLLLLACASLVTRGVKRTTFALDTVTGRLVLGNRTLQAALPCRVRLRETAKLEFDPAEPGFSWQLELATGKGDPEAWLTLWTTVELSEALTTLSLPEWKALCTPTPHGDSPLPWTPQGSSSEPPFRGALAEAPRRVLVFFGVATTFCSLVAVAAVQGQLARAGPISPPGIGLGLLFVVLPVALLILNWRRAVRLSLTDSGWELSRRRWFRWRRIALISREIAEFWHLSSEVGGGGWLLLATREGLQAVRIGSLAVPLPLADGSHSRS